MLYTKYAHLLQDKTMCSCSGLKISEYFETPYPVCRIDYCEAGVQLALLWNFNAVEGSVEYSFSANTDRGKMLLEVIEEMNLNYDKRY